jgi:hypothetical protein
MRSHTSALWCVGRMLMLTTLGDDPSHRVDVQGRRCGDVVLGGTCAAMALTRCSTPALSSLASSSCKVWTLPRMRFMSDRFAQKCCPKWRTKLPKSAQTTPVSPYEAHCPNCPNSSESYGFGRCIRVRRIRKPYVIGFRSDVHSEFGRGAHGEASGRKRKPPAHGASQPNFSSPSTASCRRWRGRDWFLPIARSSMLLTISASGFCRFHS